MAPSPSPPPPTKASLKAWWKTFTVMQKIKPSSPPGAVFGVPLRESLRYASVQISTANHDGELYVWGYIPVVVAKCGLFLKENGTEVEGIFRINGSNRRMRELQTVFETPPRYGKNIRWQDFAYTPHDVASVFRRFLTQMPEPIIPHALYHDFRDTYSRKPFVQENVVASFKSLIAKMPRANQYLLLYVLDLLTVFAKHSDQNLMNATNLAVIFRPAVLNHPSQEMAPEHHKLSQDVLEFLIEKQDWFMLDIPPPPRQDSILNTTANNSHVGIIRGPVPAPEDVYVGTVYSDSDGDAKGEGEGWRLVPGQVRIGRRRTFSERGSSRHTGRETGVAGVVPTPASNDGLVLTDTSFPSSSSAPATATTLTSVLSKGNGEEIEERPKSQQQRMAEQPKAAEHPFQSAGSLSPVVEDPPTVTIQPTEDAQKTNTNADDSTTAMDATILEKPKAKFAPEEEKRGRSTVKHAFFGSGVRRSRTIPTNKSRERTSAPPNLLRKKSSQAVAKTAGA